MVSKSKKNVPEYVVTSANATIWKTGTAILAVLLFVSIFTGGFTDWGQSPTGQVVDETADPENEDTAQEAEAGAGEQVLVVQEYSEFACPFCARFAKETHDRILEEYEGRVEIEFKHFIVHPQSAQKPAEGYECAADQGKADEYYKAVFDNQQDISVEGLTRRAEEIGLDVQEFTACLESGEKANIVQEETAEGRSKGVGGTPTFFIADEKVVGARPFEAFKEVIDKKLAELEFGETTVDDPIEEQEDEVQAPDTSNDPEIEFIVINDKTCTVCDTTQIVTVTEQQLFPTVNTREIEFSSDEAQELVDELELTALPAFIFGSSIEDAVNFNQVESSLIQTGDYYVINPAASSVLKYLETPEIGDAYIKGAEDGEIVMIEYSSFSCGFCDRARETIDSLLEKYPDQLTFVYKHFDRGGPDSDAGQAAECAGDQDMFWEMHDKIFDEGASGDFAEYADNIGLNLDEFNECMDSEKYADKVEAHTQEGIDYGIQGTPGFIVGGILVRGAQPLENFEQVIDGLLEE